MTASDPNPLLAPLSTLRGVGPKLLARLEELGLSQIEDLLYHFPLRYQDRTQVTPIGSLREGADAVVQGSVRVASIVPGRRPTLMAKVDDGTGLLTLRFFHFRRAQAQQIKSADSITLFGQARLSGAGIEMVHPEYRLDTTDTLLEEALTPIYPTVEGLGQGLWRKLTEQALNVLGQAAAQDLLESVVESDFNLAEAIRYLHRPPPGAPVDSMRDWQHPAQLRLALEELVAHHLSLQALRAEEKACPALAIKGDGSLIAPFLKALPFQPTGAQERVIGEILADMREPSPMLRLVQGDVGSGKTLVAAMACINAIESGHQIALMAPTELLAEQHLQTFGQWLTPLGIDVAWLSGKVKGRARDAVLQSIAAGSASLVIGTHALFQEGVVFASLALVIVDEQHRFGVHQRLALTEKSPGQTLPHQLVLTATPIPRTLSMVAYADLDCSVIDELPPGRTPVTTTLLDAQRRSDVIQRVGAACADGRQAYWVCTLIEESDNVDARAAEATFALLAEQLPGLSIGLIHGRLSAADKETVMADFKSGALQLLVATTVIEVGVDVPNASLMIIENPERLGLAQLHQLRGRIGRGAVASHCLMLYQAPLSRQGRERLEVMRQSTDGFYIAEQDLRLRGPGELLGTRQTGLTSFRVAQLPAHEQLLEQVVDVANQLLKRHPDRCATLVDRWTGERQAFARV